MTSQETMPQAAADAGAMKHFAVKIAEKVGALGVEAADIAGNVDEIAARVKGQSERFHQLDQETRQMVQANGAIAKAADVARDQAGTAASSMRESQGTVVQAVEEIHRLVEGVARIEERLGAVGEALSKVANVAHVIEDIAAQTNLLALNATIEAARAGDAGKGFAVVAGEVKALADQTKRATGEIDGTVKELTQQVNDLINEGRAGAEAATSAETGASAINESIDTVAAMIQNVEAEVSAIAAASQQNQANCDTVTAHLEDLVAGVDDAAGNIEQADRRLQRLLEANEAIMTFIADSGYETVDSGYIQLAQDTAKAVADLFELALASGELSESQLFDTNYQAVAGTSPQQHMTQWVGFTDRHAQALTDPHLERDKDMKAFVIMDRNGYIGTHNARVSHPQRADDPEWNQANCRQRLIYEDRSAQTAAKNTKPFLLQTLRRDLGGGKTMTVKDISAPIMVRGRHWGCARMAV